MPEAVAGGGRSGVVRWCLTLPCQPLSLLPRLRTHGTRPPANRAQLYSRNADVDRVNSQELARLPGAAVLCRAQDSVEAIEAAEDGTPAAMDPRQRQQCVGGGGWQPAVCLAGWGVPCAAPRNPLPCCVHGRHRQATDPGRPLPSHPAVQAGRSSACGSTSSSATAWRRARASSRRACCVGAVGGHRRGWGKGGDQAGQAPGAPWTSHALKHQRPSPFSACTHAGGRPGDAGQEFGAGRRAPACE